MTRDARARLIGAIVLVMVFAAGASAGLAWTGWRQSGRSMQTVDFQIRQTMPLELKRLNLSDDQRARVQTVLGNGRVETDSLIGEFEPRFRKVFDSVDARIRDILTPEQRARLDAARRGGTLRVLERRTDSGGKSVTTVDTVPRSPRP